MQLATANQRRLFFALLYLNQGAPIGLIWLAMPTLLRSQDVPIDSITGMTALVSIPWMLKFLAGPLIDRLSMLRGGARTLLIVMQSGMALTILLAANYAGPDDLNWLTWVLLGHTTCAALQDVTIDALAIRITPVPERGRLNSAMQIGMYGGRSWMAGLALGALGEANWKVACIVLASLQCLTILVVALIRTSSPPADNPHDRGHVLKEALIAALTRRSTWLGLAFAGIAGAGFEAAAILSGPWLIDRGVATESIGRWEAIGVPLMIVAGSLIGGLIADARGHRTAVALGLVGFVVAIVVMAMYDHFVPAGLRGLPAWILLGAMRCAVGVFIVGSYAMFMDLADPRIGGTQFSAFMSATNGCEAWAVAVGGMLAAKQGYGVSVMLMSLVSICSLVLLRFLKPAG